MLLYNEDVALIYNHIGGGHLGRDKTLEKICSRFFWKNMGDDIRRFLLTCDVCQRTSDAKFVKVDAALHPIPIKPNVWSQVFQTP